MAGIVVQFGRFWRTGRAAAAFVLRGGCCGGKRMLILLNLLRVHVDILRGLLIFIVTRYVREYVQMEMVEYQL